MGARNQTRNQPRNSEPRTTLTTHSSSLTAPMPLVSPAAVRRQIQAGTPDPVYLVLGEDEVEKSALAHEFEHLVEDDLRAFNVETIHVGEATTGERVASAVSTLIDAARTLPMM